jgi:hypothetical protein
MAALQAATVSLPPGLAVDFGSPPPAPTTSSAGQQVASPALIDSRFQLSDALVSKLIDRHASLLRDLTRVLNAEVAAADEEKKRARVEYFSHLCSAYIRVLSAFADAAEASKDRPDAVQNAVLTKDDLRAVIPFEFLADEPALQALLYTAEFLGRKGYDVPPGMWTPPQPLPLPPLLPPPAVAVRTSAVESAQPGDAPAAAVGDSTAVAVAPPPPAPVPSVPAQDASFLAAGVSADDNSMDSSAGAAGPGQQGGL